MCIRDRYRRKRNANPNSLQSSARNESTDRNDSTVLRNVSSLERVQPSDFQNRSSPPESPANKLSKFYKLKDVIRNDVEMQERTNESRVLAERTIERDSSLMLAQNGVENSMSKARMLYGDEIARLGSSLLEQTKSQDHIQSSRQIEKSTLPRGKINLRNRKTVYQQEYQEQDHRSQLLPVIKHDQFHYSPKMKHVGFRSTNKEVYRKWEGAVPPKLVKQEENIISVDAPHFLSSSYQDEFADWGSQPVYYFKRMKHVSAIPELKFRAKSNYRQEFVEKGGSKWERNKEICFKNPIEGAFPIFGHSSYEHYHKKLNVEPPQLVKVKEEYEVVPTFKGQYQSTQRQAYKRSSTRRTQNAVDILPSKSEQPSKPVSYTHLTLPTIYSV
eukprot:TRINITY_DN11561_c0_g1_i3.p1 TRINITY_DN11561_c0_g1~~TRINITY_DN11561_c0_g1_i3.p1  ORF type:complete len:405 (-),score=67.82 TRINITY_DN11561_c0_g1_i3:34-1191(-)